MKKLMYIRTNKTITDVSTNKAETFESINKAKKESHKKQKSTGGLGAGSLMVR